MQIDLVQLRTFVAVAEEQHLTRAAERLHVSQSAASAHVRAVEETLDTQLFVRTNRNLELTRTGELLLRKAKTLLNEATLFTSYARELRGKTEGNIVVGSNSESSESRLGEVVATLRSAHPLITIDLRARPSAGTRQGLKAGELDVGVLLGRPVDPSFRYYTLTTVQFIIAGPIAWKEQIERADLAELATLPWITPIDNSLAYSSVLARLFTDKGLTLNTVVSFDSSALARSLLPAGVGMTLMRAERAAEGVRDGYLAVSPIAQEEFGLYFAHLGSRKNDPLICAFVEAASAVWPEMRLTN
jgi:DNA-binding transcriptional LysR family regulator